MVSNEYGLKDVVPECVVSVSLMHNNNILLILRQVISTKFNNNKHISVGSPPKPKSVLEERVHTSTILNKHIKDIITIKIKNKL